MIFFWIQLVTISDPGFFRLADFEFALFAEEIKLHPELSREPKVIGIQECQPFPSWQPGFRRFARHSLRHGAGK